MAHVIKYQKLNDSGISDTAAAIYNSYVESGKIIDFDKVVTLAGTYCYLRFTDEETADAYLAEMAAINENETTGNDRGPLVRYDE